MKHSYLAALLLGAGLLAGSPAVEAQNIIPRPSSYTAATGSFTFTSGTKVACEDLPDSLETEAQRFIEAFNTASGLGITASADAPDGVICEQVSNASLGAEGYKLVVRPESIKVQAQTAAGFFHAFQSLKMLLPRNVMAEKADPTVTEYSVTACTITDVPRFGYRGFMLDCARHFFSVDQIKRMLDVMAYYKMNRFQWHLTDDQGWRFEMPKYPKLQTIAASRQGSYNVDPVHGRYYDADQYGPYYYTVEDMKEVVAYAAERHIMVIPEIEMPGHMCAAITAYPEFSCTPYGAHRVWNDGGISTDVLNIANPAAIQFCKDILDELTEIFPAPYIHIGGDECPSSAWESNEDCLALKDSLGYTNIRGLQSHFTNSLIEYMANKEDPAKRRHLIAWNESVTAGGSDLDLLRNKDLTIMCWVGAENASNTAQNLGLPTIITPQPQWYINRKQSPRPGEVHNAGGGTDATLQIVYNHRPTIRQKTLGVQGTFWCEHVSSDWVLEYQALPRLIAMAEVGWTEDDRRDFDNFLTRLRVDTTLLNYGDYAWCDYLVREEGGTFVAPEEGKYYRLDSRAGSPRAGRSIALLCKDSPALEDYAANGAKAGVLWSEASISDEADTLRKYQRWQFVADPDGSGKYAMVCEAWPNGSVSPSPSATTTDGLWSYDYTTRHYNFILNDSQYFGTDGDAHYYAIRSDQLTVEAKYMNMAASAKQLRINVYNKPDDGNGGLFTFTDLTPYEPTTPQPGAYYRLVTRATDTRSGRAIELVCKDSPLVTDEATQATVGQLWSNTPITDEADTIQKYQYWQFVADPDGSGKYAIVNKAWPEGSVNPTATSTELSGRWTYDYTTRHYNFALGAGGNVGNANGVDFYDISSDQHPGYYFNSAGVGQKMAINVYNKPEDTSAGIFNLEPEHAVPSVDYESIPSGEATYRIENVSPYKPGLRLTDNGTATLGYSTSAWSNDAWTVTASEASGGQQTITLTNTTTGRSVATAASPVLMGETPVELTLAADADFGDFTINTAEGAKLYPIGENYSIDGGTVYADLSALYPQGSNWRFTEVVRAVYTARDAEGKLIGTYTCTVEKGQPYTPAVPEITGYECTTDPATLTGTDNAQADLAYDVTYRRTTYTATLRSLDPNGLLIAETDTVVPVEKAAAFSWTAPDMGEFYTFASSGTSDVLTLESDSLIDLVYNTEALPSFAEALEPVSEIEDGHYYLLFNNTNVESGQRSGFLSVNPTNRQIVTSYAIEGTPAHVWKAEKSGDGFKLMSSNGLYIPRLSNSANINVGTTADTFTFTRDGDNWTIQGSNGTYFNGKAGAFTGWSGPHPYKVYTFRTAPYYSITYTCTRDGRYSVGLGTYTFYVAAGQPYTLECPVDAPNGYRYVTCSEKQTSGIMTKNLEVTYDFTRRPVDVGIDAIENGQAGDKAWYDLSGRRVSNPQKGVYIHQGKKVVLP